MLVPWPAPPLRSRDRVGVRVRVGDGTRWGAWSATSVAEVGLLDASDWRAVPVGPAQDSAPLDPPGRLRSTFTLPAVAAQARLYLSGSG